MMRYLLFLVPMLMLQGCGPILPADEWNALKAERAKAEAEAKAKADKVRFIPSEQVQKCTYITQSSAIAPLSHFGGMQATEENAKNKLKAEAVKLGADSIRITDRLHDKGRGGYDKTTLTIYGDLYKCLK